MTADDDPFELFNEVNQGPSAKSGDNKASTGSAVPQASATGVSVSVVEERYEGSTVADVEQLSEQFRRNTDLALKAQAEIMRLPLDPDSPTYRSVLAAKASVSSNQVSAQIRTDENAVKARTADIDYYTELKRALEAYQAGKRLEKNSDDGAQWRKWREDSKPTLAEYSKRGPDDDNENR